MVFGEMIGNRINLENDKNLALYSVISVFRLKFFVESNFEVEFKSKT